MAVRYRKLVVKKLFLRILQWSPCHKIIKSNGHGKLTKLTLCSRSLTKLNEHLSTVNEMDTLPLLSYSALVCVCVSAQEPMSMCLLRDRWWCREPVPTGHT